MLVTDRPDRWRRRTLRRRGSLRRVGRRTRFLDRVPARVNLGRARSIRRSLVPQPPTRDAQAVRSALGGCRSAVARRPATRSTPRCSRSAPRGRHSAAPPAAIVLLNDGASTRGRVARRRPRGPPPDPDLHDRARHGRRHDRGHGLTRRDAHRARAARRQHDARGRPLVTAGSRYSTVDGERLREVYERLGSQLPAPSASRSASKRRFRSPGRRCCWCWPAARCRCAGSAGFPEGLLPRGVDVLADGLRTGRP